jgi:beta-N-acetylhexosaminidase
MHDSGMKTTGKHFPGHGSIVADSHVCDVCDSRTLEQITASDLLPFRELAEDLDALMIAHVVYSAVDPLPAGYSSRWLKSILRQDLAYRGIIFSDDLGMHAAKSVGNLVERTRLCLDAGCDLVLVCQPGDVEELLGKLDEPLNDSSVVISSLYGQPTVNREELVVVDKEGIKEWRRWRQSLEELGAQSWGGNR